jgi:TadE-like protein
MGLSHFEPARLGRLLRSWRAGAIALAATLVAVGYKIFSDGQLGLFSNPGASLDFPELSGRFPHYSIFTSSFISSVWPMSLLAILLTIIAIRLISVIARSKNTVDLREVDAESGSSAVEFVLVIPPLAVLLLMILQIALIVQAKFVVNYAAFCAARSAVVVIPDNLSANRIVESRNQIGNPDTSEKLETIHRAAALPLSAISPLKGFSAATGLPILTNPDATVELLKLIPFDVGSPSMVGQMMLRAPYAYHQENTVVKVLTLEGNEGGSFRDHDWVTVKVTYRYYLAVPFAKKLFGTSYSNNPISNFLFGTNYYYPITEQYTLPVDGEPML